MPTAHSLPRCLIRLSLAVTANCVIAIAAVAQGLPEAIVGRPATLLPNGGFDIGDRAGHPIAWTVEGDESRVTVIADKSREMLSQGMAALKIDAGTSAVTVSSERIVCQAGTALTLTANLKGADERGTPPTLAIEFFDFNRKSLDRKNVTPKWSKDWQSVKLSVTAPDGTAHAVVSIVAGEKATGATFWDEAVLQIDPAAYDSKLAGGRELFLDDYRIDTAYFVGRVVHQAEITPQPIIRVDKPWEGSAYIYGSVYKIDGKFRMWYTAHNNIAPNYHTAYAESTDGIHWTKPELGIVDYKGSKANNLTNGGGTVAYNPDAPADRRYVSLSFEKGEVNDTLGYYIFTSADGLHWKKQSDKPALFDGDVSNIGYDPIGKQYIATVKKRMFTARTPGIYERTAFISTSKDAIEWSPPRIAVSGDYADDGYAESLGGFEAQIYGLPVSRYESTYVAFPWVFSIVNYVDGKSSRTGDGPVDVQIASSRDLLHWARPVRKRLIEPGNPGSWNAGSHYCASNLLVDDEHITLYYGAFTNGHGGADMDDPHRGANVGQIGMARWRRDGWVSLTNAGTANSGKPGVVTLKPIRMDGDALHLNANVREGGSLKVELLDAKGQPIKGFEADAAEPITGDHLDQTVKWKSQNDTQVLSGQEVVIKLYMVDVDVYSFWLSKN